MAVVLGAGTDGARVQVLWSGSVNVIPGLIGGRNDTYMGRAGGVVAGPDSSRDNGYPD